MALCAKSETKVILTLLARYVARAKNLRDAYDAIKSAANTEGLTLPSFDEMKEEFKVIDEMKDE